jgi:hypothetical protein
MSDQQEVQAPRLGRGLSRQYSLYPRKPSLGSIKGLVTRAIDVVKFLYTNEFTRSIGRDVLFFGGSVLLIRMLASSLKDELNPSTSIS